MGVRVSDLKNATAPLTVKCGDIEVNLRYRPTAISSARQDEFMAELDANKYTDAMVTFLPDVIASWDLENDDGTPFPIDANEMRNVLPNAFLRKCLEDVLGDMYPKVKSESGSGGTSSTDQAHLGSAPSGTA